MDDTSSGEPDGDEDGHQLGQSDRARCLKNVEILQDVRNGHEP